MSATVKWIAVVLLVIGAALYIPGAAGFALLVAAVLIMPVKAFDKIFANPVIARLRNVLTAVLLVTAVFLAPTGGFGADALEYALTPKQSYVLNVNSMRFHLPECDGVKDIKPANRKDFTGLREELTDEGYIPCGACQP